MPLELNRVKMRSFVVAIALCFVTSPTFAWNSFGHRCVAEIAWQQLEAPTRQQIVDTLRRHPRFVEDFAGKMPNDIAKADQATQDRWIFLQAATWPDTCRKTDYDRPWWHVINVPVFVGDERRVTFNQSPDYPSDTTAEKYNCIQAVKFALATLRDPQTPPGQRAIALCWEEHGRPSRPASRWLKAES